MQRAHAPTRNHGHDDQGSLPKDISELRARTGAGMMDCKAALEEAGGDMDLAVEILRKRGAAKADKRSGRSASQGLVVIASHQAGADVTMMELNCETDFVARTDDFIALAKELAVLAEREAPVGIHDGAVLDGLRLSRRHSGRDREAVSGKTGEAMVVKRSPGSSRLPAPCRATCTTMARSGCWSMSRGPPARRSRPGAGSRAAHCVGRSRGGERRRHSGRAIERERRIAEEQVAAEGKPENIRAKIVEGKIRKFVAERTLLSQPFVKDESKKISDLVAESATSLGGPVAVKRFARFKVGEA